MISPLNRSRRIPLIALFALGSALVAGCGDANTGTGTAAYNSRSKAPATNSGNSGSDTSGSGNGAAPNGSPSGNTTGTPSTDPGKSGDPGTPADPGTPSTPGDTGNPGTPPATSPAFDVLVDNAAPSIELQAETVVQVTVAPQSFTGDVALSVTGLPTDVTGAFDTATVKVSGTAAATAKLTLKSLSSAKPVATPFQVVATSGTTTKKVAVTVSVKSVITIKIPVNVDAMPGPATFGTVNITAPANLGSANPVTVKFLNLDSTPHEIHAGDPTLGFPHGKGTFGQNQSDTPRTITSLGTAATSHTFNFYLHDQGSAKTPGKIVVSQ